MARSDYSASNSVPGPLRLALAGAGVLGLGCLVRAVWLRRARRRAAGGDGRGAGAPAVTGDEDPDLHGETLPEGLPADRFVEAEVLVQTLHMWEESLTVRPDGALTFRHGLTLWELVDG